MVGSRAVGRSAADSPVPVDIIDGDSLRNYGVRDLNNLLAATVPSYNVTQHAIGDANSLVRPAKMRGLPPDSTLVLVNGKRRHRSSAVSIFTFGQAQGAHGVDIRSIPSIALKRVEVLRDGAGAQYGSDAGGRGAEFCAARRARGRHARSELGAILPRGRRLGEHGGQHRPAADRRRLRQPQLRVHQLRLDRPQLWTRYRKAVEKRRASRKASRDGVGRAGTCRTTINSSATSASTSATLTMPTPSAAGRNARLWIRGISGALIRPRLPVRQGSIWTANV